MLVDYKSDFLKKISKIRDNLLKLQIKKQIIKIINNPDIGKPMKYDRRGTREVYITPFRLSYILLKKEDKLIFLDLYHKNKQ